MPSNAAPSALRNVLFVPHGSPMFALNPGAAGAAMIQVTQQLPTPRAIVVISPHWETVLPTVGLATQPETIHDFYGFPAPLYDLRYPAIGCPEVANAVVQALQAQGFEVETDAQRGLDHGAWIPLRHMFPHADVPVIPLSVQSHAGPAHAYRIGQALAEELAVGLARLHVGHAICHAGAEQALKRSQGRNRDSGIEDVGDATGVDALPLGEH